MPRSLMEPNSPDVDFTTTEVDGDVGDVWRCECSRLWRVADACDTCDANGGKPHWGLHVMGETWRRARLWQRLRLFRRGR
ncbi:hypothetical protein ACFFMN_23870 [Planobispora siamensis]|uniref:hypothetical protein n=1 Tax=Planobispora siamensis TaxID=936338 RepID=UPI0019523C19|nr:hypothetical protein [Planobispora siamensis]